MNFAKLFSRKLWMTLLSLALCSLTFWWQADYLYSFAEYGRSMDGLYEPGTSQTLTTAFTSMVKDYMVLFGAIILAYLGVNGVIQWRHGTESVTQLASAAQTIFQKTEVDERIVQEFAQRYKDDPSYVQPDKVPDMNVEEFR